MDIVKITARNQFAVWAIARLTEEEAKSPSDTLPPSKTPGYWGGQILERRAGVRTGTVYASVKLFTD